MKSSPPCCRATFHRGTELDCWNGKTFVSMVGFLFQKTSVLGMPALGYRNFEEVNLRFMPRRQTLTGWRRGVVFIKEIVPRRLIAFIARAVYNEAYVALPMRHSLQLPVEQTPGRVQLRMAAGKAGTSWKPGSERCACSARPGLGRNVHHRALLGLLQTA